MFTIVFLLNIVYFSACLFSNKLYWIEDQLADSILYVGELASVSWTVGELTVILIKKKLLTYTDSAVFEA